MFGVAVVVCWRSDPDRTCHSTCAQPRSRFPSASTSRKRSQGIWRCAVRWSCTSRLTSRSPERKRPRRGCMTRKSWTTWRPSTGLSPRRLCSKLAKLGIPAPDPVRIDGIGELRDMAEYLTRLQDCASVCDLRAARKIDPPFNGPAQSLLTAAAAPPLYQTRTPTRRSTAERRLAVRRQNRLFSALLHADPHDDVAKKALKSPPRKMRPKSERLSLLL